MRFSYLYFMKNEPDRIRMVAPRHASYWHTRGLTSFQGGPFVDRSGGLITFEAESNRDAARLVASDPFVVEDLLEQRWLKEWVLE
jgi:hypothetical protein